jgi:hypothetical protein
MKQFHLVNWFLVRSSREHGGLSVQDLGLVNIALGSKFLWRLVRRLRMVEKGPS